MKDGKEEVIDKDSTNFDFDNSRGVQGLDPTKKAKEENLMKIAETMASDDDKKGSNGISKEIMNEIRNSVLVKKVDDDPKASEPTLADFKMIIVLGKGTFGKVFLAEFQRNKQLYAIKVIRKDILIEYN
mmetsp:Transcript_4066/g.6088  ORF Transcript_4066/g.6088 Transcript_4066/m.6088 type:complete len:129 (-) Transcript_4066:886-1272(-)